MRFAEYEIDLVQHELRRGEVVPIEPQVFDLLVHLVRNRERIVSKDELFDTIWHGRIVSEAALSSRISAARRAIGDNGDGQSLIRTIYKRGFRFVGVVDAAPSVEESALRVPPATADAHNEGSTAAVQTKSDLPAQVDAATATGRPAIAVLPFSNLSGDGDNEHFSQGLMEDLIRLLARNRWLNVISRHSSSVSDPSRSFAQIGEGLNVRYILTGSVRRSHETVRIAAELVCAADSTQLWAEVYEVPLAGIFDTEEEMARQIAATIEPELARIEQQRAARKAPRNLDAWDCYQRGLWHLWTFTGLDFEKAEQFLRRSIESDPTFARAHAHLGYVDVQRALYDVPPDRLARIERAIDSARTGIALDDRDCIGHCVLGRAFSLLRRHDEAELALDTALELNPSFAQGYFAQGFNYLWAGRALDAEALLDRAIMLSPHDSHLWSFYHVRAWARFSLGEMEAAARFALRATHQPNVTYRAFATLAAVLGLLGDGREAAAAAAELLKRKPDYTGAYARREFFFCGDDAFVERYVAGLRVAGVTAGRA